MLVLRFSQPPKVGKIQLSRGPALRMDIQVSYGETFRKSRFPFPWEHHSSRWCGQCKSVAAGRKPWTPSAMQVRASLHLSPPLSNQAWD